MTTQLYRHYDDQDNLLYVGISKTAQKRFFEHLQKSEWANASSRMEITHFNTRNEALEAEKEAIVNEKPMFNKIHNGVNRINNIDLLIEPEHSLIDSAFLMKAVLLGGSCCKVLFYIISNMNKDNEIVVYGSPKKTMMQSLGMKATNLSLTLSKMVKAGLLSSPYMCTYVVNKDLVIHGQ